MGKRFALLNVKDLARICSKSRIEGDEFIGHLKLLEEAVGVEASRKRKK